MAALSYAELEGLWIQAGGDPSVAPIMAAIAFPESGANPAAVQQGQPYATTGWGLWQITPGNSVPSVGINEALLDPLTNARAAVAKYNSQGLGAWTTFTSGAYKQFLQSGVAPAAGSATGGATNTGFFSPLTDFLQSTFGWFATLGKTLSGVMDAFSSVSGHAEQAIRDIFMVHFWARVASVLTGIVAALFGLYLFAKGEPPHPIQTIKRVGGDALRLAEVAGAFA